MDDAVPSTYIEKSRNRYQILMSFLVIGQPENAWKEGNNLRIKHAGSFFGLKLCKFDLTTHLAPYVMIIIM